SSSFFLTTGRPPSFPLLPYTTLFRSPEALGNLCLLRGSLQLLQLVEVVCQQTIVTTGIVGFYRLHIRRGYQTFGHGIGQALIQRDRKSTRLNSSHVKISYAVFCLKKK